MWIYIGPDLQPAEVRLTQLLMLHQVQSLVQPYPEHLHILANLITQRSSGKVVVFATVYLCACLCVLTSLLDDRDASKVATIDLSSVRKLRKSLTQQEERVAYLQKHMEALRAEFENIQVFFSIVIYAAGCN